MINYFSAFLIFLLPILNFAQEIRPERPNFSSSDDPTHRFATSGGNPDAPIDDYAYFLVAIAIFLLVYVVYKRTHFYKNSQIK